MVPAWANDTETVSFSTFDATMGYIGEVQVEYNPNTTYLLINKEEFIALLRPVVQTEYWKRIRNLLKDLKFVSPQLLYSLGIKTKVNFNFFKIFLEISPEVTQTRELHLRRVAPSKAVAEQSFNGYLNYAVGKYFDDPLIQNPAYFNPVLGFKNWSFENNLQYRDTDQRLLRLGTRFIHDNQERVERTILGEQGTQTMYLDFNFNFTGASHVKQYTITPQYQYRILGNQEFILESPSRVEIFVNNILVQVLQLPAGRHLVNEIPVTQGLNNIVIKMIDGSGAERVLIRQLSIDQDMLSKNVFLYGLYGGRINTITNSEPVTTTKEVGAIFLRYGFSDYLTSSVQVLTSEDVGYFNVNNTFGTKIGTFRHDLKITDQYEASLGGVASKETFFWMCPCWLGNTPIRLGLFHEYVSENALRNFSPVLLTSPYDLNFLGGTYSLQFLDNASISFGAGQGYRKSELVEKNFDVGLNFSILRKINANLSFREITRSNQVDQSGSLFLTYLFDKPNTFVTHKSTLNDKVASHQTDLSYNQNKMIKNLTARVSHATGDDFRAYRAFSSYSTPFTRISGELLQQERSGEISKSSFLGLNGSMAFVGSDFAFGNPINDSYILVKNELKDDVIVNGSDENHEMYVSKGSSRLLTITQPYFDKNINAFSANESSIEPKNFKKMARYKQGAKVNLIDQFTPSVSGSYDMAQISSEAKSIGAVLRDAGKEHFFFVTEDGKFLIENVPAGTYEVTLFARRPIKTTLTIPQSEDKIIDIGLQAIKP
jgi:outer membrane usher protein